MQSAVKYLPAHKTEKQNTRIFTKVLNFVSCKESTAEIHYLYETYCKEWNILKY